MVIVMKALENGVLYDTATAQPLAAFQFSLCGVPAEEAAYRGPEGRCFTELYRILR